MRVWSTVAMGVLEVCLVIAAWHGACLAYVAWPWDLREAFVFVAAGAGILIVASASFMGWVAFYQSWKIEREYDQWNDVVLHKIARTHGPRRLRRLIHQLH